MKTTMTKYLLLSLAAVLLLGACAPTTKIQNMANEAYHEDSFEFLARDLFPYFGVLETEAILNGNINVVKIDMNVELARELSPGRSNFYGFVVNIKTGKVFMVQSLFSGLIGPKEPFFMAIIDGDESIGMNEEDCYFVQGSTKFTRGYDGNGKMFPVDPKRLSDSAYRIDIATKYGSKVADLQKTANGKELVADILKNWNVFTRKSDGARFRTSLSKERIEEISVINPRYDFWNKFKYEANLSVAPLNFVATVVGLGFDVLKTVKASSYGLDFDSDISRDEMGFAMEYFLAIIDQNFNSIVDARVNESLKEMVKLRLIPSANEVTPRLVEKKVKPKARLQKTVANLDDSPPPRKQVERITEQAQPPVQVARPVSRRVDSPPPPKKVERIVRRARSVPPVRVERPVPRGKATIAEENIDKNLRVLGLSSKVVEVFKEVFENRGGMSYIPRSRQEVRAIAAGFRVKKPDSWNLSFLGKSMMVYRLRGNNEIISVAYYRGQWIRFHSSKMQIGR